MGSAGLKSPGAASIDKNPRMFPDSARPALQELMHGATLYISAKSQGKDFFQVNDLILDTSVYSLYLSGPDLYYFGAASLDSREMSPGYFKNGVFHPLDLKKNFELDDIQVDNGDVYVLGWDRDSLNQNIRCFLFKNGKKQYLQTGGKPDTTGFIGQKMMIERGNAYLAGVIADAQPRRAALWKQDSILELTNPNDVVTGEVIAISRFKGSILFSGRNHYPWTDYFVSGGWYWREGVRYPIKYDEDGDESNPNDYLRIEQFIVSGDSLLAIGNTSSNSAPSYTWVNGKAEPWEDTTIHMPKDHGIGPKLLGIANCQGILYLLGQYQKDTVNFQRNVLCLWSQGKRIDLLDSVGYVEIHSFQVVKQEGAGIRPSKPAKRQDNSSRSYMRQGRRLYGNLPGRSDSSASTVDGKIFPPARNPGAAIRPLQ